MRKKKAHGSAAERRECLMDALEAEPRLRTEAVSEDQGENRVGARSSMELDDSAGRVAHYVSWEI